MHRNEDINLSLFSFPEFCTLDEQELRIFDYMKDVVLDEAVPIKFNSYFLTFDLSSMNFEIWMNGQVYNK
jgi:hypothetical protein